MPSVVHEALLSELRAAPAVVGALPGRVGAAVAPEAVPRVEDPAEAEAAPERTLLSVLAHGRDPGAALVAEAALDAASPEQLDAWVDAVIRGELPAELLAAPG